MKFFEIISYLALMLIAMAAMNAVAILYWPEFLISIQEEIVVGLNTIFIAFAWRSKPKFITETAS